MENKEQCYAAIEAILFAIGDPVSAGKLAAAIGITKEEALLRIDELQQSYEDAKRGIRIVEIDGAYQLCTKTELYTYLEPIVIQQHNYQLTDTVLETLSIIA